MTLKIRKLNVVEIWRAYRFLKPALPAKLPGYDVLLIDFIHEIIGKLHRSNYFNFLEIITHRSAMDLTEKYSPLELVAIFVEGFEINRIMDFHATMIGTKDG